MGPTRFRLSDHQEKLKTKRQTREASFLYCSGQVDLPDRRIRKPHLYPYNGRRRSMLNIGKIKTILRSEVKDYCTVYIQFFTVTSL